MVDVVIVVVSVSVAVAVVDTVAGAFVPLPDSELLDVSVVQSLVA